MRLLQRRWPDRHRRWVRPTARVVSLIALAGIAGCVSAPLVQGAGTAPAQSVTDDSTYDVVIVNGKVVDGSGNAWFYGDVAIRGDRIAGRPHPQPVGGDYS